MMSAQALEKLELLQMEKIKLTTNFDGVILETTDEVEQIEESQRIMPYISSVDSSNIITVGFSQPLTTSKETLEEPEKVAIKRSSKAKNKSKKGRKLSS